MRRILITFMLGFAALSGVSRVEAQDVILKVLDGGGLPGSTGNVVPVYITNEKYVSNCDFTLFWNTLGIVVRDVTTDGRSRAYRYDWDAYGNGVWVSTRSFMDPGSGILLYVVFDVVADLSSGDYSLDLIEVGVVPETLSVGTENGTFFVRHAILTAQQTGGVPGGIKREITIELMNDRTVAGCQFDLHLDLGIFTVTDVLSPAHTQWEYGWSQTDRGTRVTKTGGPGYLQPTAVSIVRIVCNVSEGTPYGDYDIDLDSLAVTDSLGDPVASVAFGGIFIVVPAVFSVTSMRGYPGDKGLQCAIDLENEVFVHSMAVDLLFDTERLSAKNIAMTDRGKGCHFMAGTMKEGVRMVWLDCGYPLDKGIVPVSSSFGDIHPGSGSVCTMLFDVAGDAPSGDYELSLDAKLYHDASGSIPFSLEPGIFSILLQGDINSDGQVDIQDVLTTVDIILGLYHPTPDELLGADCNADGVVNILDVVRIVKIILNG